MAYTLAQLAKLETDPMKKGVIMNILRDARVMEFMPWENVTALESLALRYRTLPTGGAFRKIGGSYTEATDGDVEKVWESVYPFGGELKFDKIFDLVKNTIIDPKIQQTQMRLKSMALDFNNYLINGDHATNADGFEGLKKRVAGMPSRQSLAIGDSDSLDVTASVANARKFLDNWNKAWYRCNSGEVGAIFMNEEVMLGFGQALVFVNMSAGNLLDVTKDSFEREIITYKGAPMIDMGLKTDQSTEIITLTETALDAAADATSVYFASLGGSEGLTGIQLNAFEFYDINGGQELETAPATAKRLDWVVGLAGFSSYHLTRLSNLKAPTSWT